MTEFPPELRTQVADLAEQLVTRSTGTESSRASAHSCSLACSAVGLGLSPALVRPMA
jgi:hypothetical protein